MNTQQRFDFSSSVIPPDSAARATQALARRTPDGADSRRLLRQFEPIGLAQMDGVALLDRTDTKYVLRTSQLYSALAALSKQYWVLDIDGVRVHPY